MTISSSLAGATLHYSIDGGPYSVYAGPFAVPLPADTSDAGIVHVTIEINPATS